MFAVDELAGFITAVAYVRPDGLTGMKPKSVKKKLKDKRFAAAVSREDIQVGIEELGVDLDTHIANVIAGMVQEKSGLKMVRLTEPSRTCKAKRKGCRRCGMRMGV